MLKAIWAQAMDGTFGIDGQLPWSIRAEMEHFLSTVKGNIVVMGKNTFNSLRKPIANCLNIVVSTTLSKQTPGVFVFDSLDEVLRVLDKDMPGRDIFIIGGSKLIEDNIHRVDEVIVSIIPYTYIPSDGTVYAPKCDKSAWECYEQKAIVFNSFLSISSNINIYYFRKKKSCQPNQQNPNPPLEAQARKVVSELKEALRPAKESVQKVVEQPVAKVPQETKDALKKIVPKILDKRKLKRKK